MTTSLQKKKHKNCFKNEQSTSIVEKIDNTGNSNNDDKADREKTSTRCSSQSLAGSMIDTSFSEIYGIRLEACLVYDEEEMIAIFPTSNGKTHRSRWRGPPAAPP